MNDDGEANSRPYWPLRSALADRLLDTIRFRITGMPTDYGSMPPLSERAERSLSIKPHFLSSPYCTQIQIISDLAGNTLRRTNLGCVPRVVVFDLKPKKSMNPF
jgi:hypothetical protein